MASTGAERRRDVSFVAGVLESKPFILIVIAAGFALRGYQYLCNRSLWVDEAMLAVNIAGRSYRELLGPLDFDQGAPIGFLFLIKSSAWVFGDDELAYRLFPLLFSLAAIPAFWQVASRWLEREAAAIALAFFVVNPFLIYYAGEMKQYSSDVFFLLVLYALFLPRLTSDLSAKEAFWGSAIGALALWFSHPAVFTLAGLGLSKAAFHLQARKWSALPKLVAMGGVWIASGIGLYLISLKNLASNPKLISYWGDDFAPIAFSDLSTWKWYVHKAVEVTRDPLGFTWVGLLVLVVITVGVAGSFRRSTYLTISILSPCMILLLASMAQLYPIGGRLILFTVPIWTIFLAGGLRRVGRWNGFAAKALYPAVLVVLLFSVLQPTIRLTLNPEKEEIKPAMNYIKNRMASGDALVVPSTSYPAFLFYRSTVPEYGGLDAIACRSPSKAEAETIRCLERLENYPYVWLLLSHFTKFEKNYFLKHLDQVGEKVDQFSATGVEVHKYRIGS
jgi:hypothetical protein